jgi:hypothetical protein
MTSFRLTVIAIAASAAMSAPALADPAADCAAGIETIKAAIAANPAADKLEKLNKLLADAERELGEKEFDECLEAVEDAKEIASG